MTRETKVGIAMVLLLVGVFGFLVYKRFNRPLQEMAASDPQAVDTDSDVAAPSEDQQEPDDDPSEIVAQRSPAILPVAGDFREIPQAESGDVDDPFGESSESTASAPPLSNRPRLPSSIPDEEPVADQTAQDTFLSEADQAGVDVRSAEPEGDAGDPFLDSPGAVSSKAADDTASPPVTPFEEAPAVTEEPLESGPEPEIRAPVVSSPAVSDRMPIEANEVEEADIPVKKSIPPAFEEPSEITLKARAKQPEPTFDFEDEPAEVETPEFDVEPERPAAVESIVPALTIDDSSDGFPEDRYGDYEPIELNDGIAEAPLQGEHRRNEFLSGDAASPPAGRSINGDSHTVQAGENFWFISQKKYGTGRYFQALAAYNQAVVPDASRIKAGVKIALPSSEELERRYPSLIPKGGPSEPAAADGLTSQPGEFLMGKDGRPLYRIGAKDTLSGISQKYLGRSSRWVQILEMNRDVLKDGNSLKVGAVLRLPSDAGELQLSNQPRPFR